MSEKQMCMTQWLDSKISSHATSCKAFQLDDRADEAAFEKIAGNIYDIFRSVLSVADKACQGDDAAIGTFFLMRLTQIPVSWQLSYQQAEAHGDAAKMHIERIKLDAAANILAQFQSIWEVEA